MWKPADQDLHCYRIFNELWAQCTYQNKYSICDCKFHLKPISENFTVNDVFTVMFIWPFNIWVISVKYLTSAVMFLELFFCNIFLSSILVKCVVMKDVEETFRQLLQRVWCLCHKQIFVYVEEDFAINWICPKSLSLLLTGRDRNFKGVFSKISVSSEYPN